MNIGTISLILLFSMTFVMYAYNPTGYGFGFEAIMSFFATGDMESVINLLLSNVTGTAIGVGISIAALIGGMTGRLDTHIVAMMLLVGIASLFFTPFTYITAATQTIPEILQHFIQAFFGLLMVLAAVGFIAGRDF